MDFQNDQAPAETPAKHESRLASLPADPIADRLGVIPTDSAQNSAQAEPSPAELERGALLALNAGQVELATTLARLATMAREREAEARSEAARKDVLDLEVERAKRR